MGQGSSAPEHRSAEPPRARLRSATSRPASTILNTSVNTSTSTRSRRRSSFFGHLSPSLNRSITEPREDAGQTRPQRLRFLRSQSSLSTAFPNIFHRHASSATSARSTTPVPSPSPTGTLQPLENYLIPEPQTPQSNLPFFQESLEASLNNPDRNLEDDSLPGNTTAPWRSPSSVDPIESVRLSTNVERRLQGMTASLRRRRSPMPREDTSQLLTRLLSAAAAATAMSLTGNSETSINDLHSATAIGTGNGIDGDDGSFHGFLQSLRNGRLATLGQPTAYGADGTAEQPGAFEFFRMFRFGASHTNRRRSPRPSSRPSSSRSAGPATATRGEGTSDAPEGDRMVPVLIVGIRALNENEVSEGPTEGMPSFLDSLASTPQTINVEPPDDDATPTSEFGSRRSRRTTIGGFNFFSQDRASQRNEERSRPTTSHPSPSETPPGPHPPPTTPASPLSALSSGNTTPTRRASISSSADLSGTHSRRESLYRRLTGTALEPTLEENQSADPAQGRQRGLRRRPRISSWSDVPRHDPRRNGMLMEPGDATPTESGNTRSWIIYILGGNYPENHPILTTPSLFTDSPTYEDMLLLSNLLGAAKTPVAHADDVVSAGGLFKVSVAGNVVTMDEVNGEEAVQISASERCLVCLCEYEDGEEVRRLTKCKHFFHKECIDQWLTTGRNSCPLCRSQGVDEKERTPQAEDRASATTA